MIFYSLEKYKIKTVHSNVYPRIPGCSQMTLIFIIFYLLENTQKTHFYLSRGFPTKASVVYRHGKYSFISPYHMIAMHCLVQFGNCMKDLKVGQQKKKTKYSLCVYTEHNFPRSKVDPIMVCSKV